MGGKMFASLRLEGALPVRYSAGPERYAELLEREGIVPAPYAARIFWVAVERWSVFRNAEWQAEWTAAHALTLAKLTPRTLAALALPKTARREKRLGREQSAKA